MFLSNFSAASAKIFSRSRRESDNRQRPDPAPQLDLRELARRTVARDGVDFHTVATIEEDGELDARIMDISPYGFQCRARCRVLERGERVSILLPIVGDHVADVMWSLKGLFGCKFVEPIDSELYADLLVMLRATNPSFPDQD